MKREMFRFAQHDRGGKGFRRAGGGRFQDDEVGEERSEKIEERG